MRGVWAGVTVLAVVGPGGAMAQRANRPPGTNHIGRAFEFKRVAEGIYQAVGTCSRQPDLWPRCRDHRA